MDRQTVDKLFRYENGILYRKSRCGNQLANSAAGGYDGQGYLQVEIDSKPYKVHRLIYLLLKGYVPQFVDHINGNRTDNRIENLRGASVKENSRNASKPTSSARKFSSQWKGPALRPSGRWASSITVNYKRIYLGTYDTEWEAAQAYNEAAMKYFGEFAKLNDLGEVPGDVCSFTETAPETPSADNSAS